MVRMISDWFNHSVAATTIVVAALSVLIASALTLIYSQHQSRQLTAQMQQLSKQQIELDVEWGKLLLEQGAWSSHAHLESVARERLNMMQPLAHDIKRVEF